MAINYATIEELMILSFFSVKMLTGDDEAKEFRIDIVGHEVILRFCYCDHSASTYSC